MMQDEDERIEGLLRRDTPPAHDPLFRLGVLERREQKRFRERSLLLAAAALALVVISWIAVSAGARGFETIGVVVFGVGLAVAYFFYTPALLRLIRRFRI